MRLWRSNAEGMLHVIGFPEPVEHHIGLQLWNHVLSNTSSVQFTEGSCGSFAPPLRGAGPKRDKISLLTFGGYATSEPGSKSPLIRIPTPFGARGLRSKLWPLEPELTAAIFIPRAWSSSPKLLASTMLPPVTSSS